ncbi:MAG: zf-HC2 domain-containing protein [Planctomycetota bacterium]|nr:zf-HC2 domain-containing protein [Planctomycetota bacterium]
MDCGHTRELIPLAIGGDVSAAEQDEVRRHVAVCPECRSLWESQAAAREALRSVFGALDEGSGTVVDGAGLSESVMAKLRIDCVRAGRLAPLAAGGELPAPTAARLGWHTEKCDACRREVESYRELRQNCLAAGKPEPKAFDDAAAFWQSVSDRLEREALLGEPVVRRFSLSARARLAIAAAAVLLVGVFAGLRIGKETLWQDSGSPGSVSREPADTGSAFAPPTSTESRPPVATRPGTPSDGALAARGSSDRALSTMPVGMTGGPFNIGNYQGRSDGKSDAIRMFYVPSHSRGRFEIQQIRVLSDRERVGRKF